MSTRKKRDNVLNDDIDPALIKKKFWSFFKATSNSCRIPETVCYGARFRSKSYDIANLFNKYFSDQFSSPSKYEIDVNFDNDPLLDHSFHELDVFDLLRKMNANKAAGPDGIQSKIMKFCAKGLAKPLTIIFNKCFLSGALPKKWKLANVVPVFKKGDKASVTNYRPISLTCLPMKIFEYLIRDLILNKCEHLIRDTQHGFRNNKSCITQMLPFVDKLATALNNHSRVDVIYFDFAKAFDSVNHDLILHKLKHKFGIDGLLLQLIKDYLRDRMQKVTIDGSFSDILRVHSGVPQGSVIGPLLFVLFIDDINDCISEGTELALYADDTKIWREIRCDNDQVILQDDVNRLSEWSVANKMTFHSEKCKVLPVTNKCLNHVLPFHDHIYELNGNLLDYVQNEKDLGVVTNRQLTWNLHCEMLVIKANKQFGMLRRTCYFMADKKQRCILYISLIRSIFEHCCQIWAPQDNKSLDAIIALQKRGVKWILKEQHMSYSDQIFLIKQKNLDILPVENKFLFSDLVLFYKIINKLVNIDLPNYVIRIEPYMIKQVTRDTNESAKSIDKLKYKCCIAPKVDSFKKSYFYRTVVQWNLLPLNVRTIENIDKFEIDLKEHIWLILGLKPD